MDNIKKIPTHKKYIKKDGEEITKEYDQKIPKSKDFGRTIQKLTRFSVGHLNTWALKVSRMA